MSGELGNKSAVMLTTPLLPNFNMTVGIVDDTSEWHRWTEPPSDYVFDRIEVKAGLIVAYTAVFCCCFIGNLLVMMAILLHRRMRTITNFFLANLAFADFCVSVFCIYQNLSWYLVDSWMFGDFLCRMNHFVQYLSYTASVAILTMIAAERYMAIVHPIRSKHWITATRLRRAVATVWLSAAAYSSPRFFMYSAEVFPLPNGRSETICFLKRQIYNSKAYDTVNFGLCYVLPLTLITVMYSRVGTQLWRSGGRGHWKPKIPIRTRRQHPVEKEEHEEVSLPCIQHVLPSLPSSTASPSPAHCTEHQSTIKLVNSDEECVSQSGHPARKSSLRVSAIPRQSSKDKIETKTRMHMTGGPAAATLRARRKVIRMLVAVVLNFAICNLPYHARKLWQYFSPSYEATSNAAMLATPITFLILFMNSGMNPILYAFMSVNFRKSMTDVVTCRLWLKRFQNRHPSCTRSTTMTMNTLVACKNGSLVAGVHGSPQDQHATVVVVVGNGKQPSISRSTTTAEN